MKVPTVDAFRASVSACPRASGRLQLDDARSWVVLSEWNEFVWTGRAGEGRPLPASLPARRNLQQAPLRPLAMATNSSRRNSSSASTVLANPNNVKRGRESSISFVLRFFGR